LVLPEGYQEEDGAWDEDLGEYEYEYFLYECDYYNNWCADIEGYVIEYEVLGDCDYWNNYCGAYTYEYKTIDDEVESVPEHNFSYFCTQFDENEACSEYWFSCDDDP
jgi:hypothetical protein